jgi:hypothetical protein
MVINGSPGKLERSPVYSPASLPEIDVSSLGVYAEAGAELL